MSLFFSLPLLYREKQALLEIFALGALCLVLSTGCSKAYPFHGEHRPNSYLTSDTRLPIPLSSPAGKEHRAVMLQHLESIQVIVNALVDEDYELAKGLTESPLGFFMHRQAMVQQPENFPPAYHDLAMAHHAAAEELARIIPTKDMKQILPKLNNMLKACVACHLEFKVWEQS
jgi:hypothetical protein